jgi:hypothetical protein
LPTSTRPCRRWRVADIVYQMHAKFEGCPVRDFVPLLVGRNAKAN